MMVSVKNLISISKQILLSVLGAYFVLAAFPSAAADSAVIVMYHRLDEANFPSTNIRLEQFDAHIAELKSGGFNVRPVADIIDAVKSGKSIPLLTRL